MEKRMDGVEDAIKEHEGRLIMVEKKLEANYSILDTVLEKVSSIEFIRQQTNDLHNLFYKNGLVTEISTASKYINEQKEKEKDKKHRFHALTDNVAKWALALLGLGIVGFLLYLLDVNPETIKIVLRVFK